MTRAAAITHASAGASKLWAGTVVVQPDAKTGAHHHGELETVLYIVRGWARFRWGEKLEYVDEAGPGDFIYVPPYVPHQEINARRDQPVEAVVVRSGQEPVVVNLDIESPEETQTFPGSIRRTRAYPQALRPALHEFTSRFSSISRSAPSRNRPPYWETTLPRRGCDPWNTMTVGQMARLAQLFLQDLVEFGHTRWNPVRPTQERTKSSALKCRADLSARAG